MTETKNQPIPVKRKPLGKTIWKDERPVTCEVCSTVPPPQEIERFESLGRLTVKGGDPEFAAKHYREVKKLPESWPVEVKVKDKDGKVTLAVILPDPSMAITDEENQPPA